MRILSRALTLLCFLGGIILAASQEDFETSDKLAMSGMLEFSLAEFLKARTSGGGGTSQIREPITVDHIWYGHAIATLNFISEPYEFFKIKSSFEVRQYATMLPLTPGARRDADFGSSYWNGFYLREGQGIFIVINDDALLLDVAFGYMPYKYNPEVCNLGEFLFRSGTYPLYLLNEFNRPFARIKGLRAGLKMSGDMFSLKADFLGLVEHEMKPFNDISLAGVLGVNLLTIVDIGAGIDLAHFIPVDSRFTTLKEQFNSYKYDSVYDATNQVWTYDTGYYTYQGTKLMARGALDLFGFFQFVDVTRGGGSFLSDMFGPAGGKVYGEYAIIGLEKYPADFENNPRGYTSVAERSPWMVGVTIPFWKIFDVCAIEFERFPSYFPDNYWTPVINAYPLPVKPVEGSYDSTVYVPRWNWSLYMKKQFTRNFGLVGNVGRDHHRWEMHPAQYPYYDFEPAAVKPDEWGWNAAAVFSF